MKFAKSTLIGAGGVLLAGLILTLAAPKAAHAIAATAVQVENTIASPVVTQAILPRATVRPKTCTVIGPPNLISCTLTPPVPSQFTFHVTQQAVHADPGQLPVGSDPSNQRIGFMVLPQQWNDAHRGRVCPGRQQRTTPGKRHQSRLVHGRGWTGCLLGKHPRQRPRSSLHRCRLPHSLNHLATKPAMWGRLAACGGLLTRLEPRCS